MFSFVVFSLFPTVVSYNTHNKTMEDDFYWWNLRCDVDNENYSSAIKWCTRYDSDDGRTDGRTKRQTDLLLRWGPLQMLVGYGCMSSAQLRLRMSMTDWLTLTSSEWMSLWGPLYFRTNTKGIFVVISAQNPIKTVTSTMTHGKSFDS